MLSQTRATQKETTRRQYRSGLSLSHTHTHTRARARARARARTLPLSLARSRSLYLVSFLCSISFLQLVRLVSFLCSISFFERRKSSGPFGFFQKEER